MDHVPLPPPAPPAAGSAEAVLARRRTGRTFTDEPITTHHLSQLVWAAQGITGADGARTAPSAGGIHPLHVLVAAAAVTDVAPALLRYEPEAHELVPVAMGDHRDALERTAIGEQPWVGRAAVVLVVVADMTAVTAHFHDQEPAGERGRRYAFIEAGAVVQNVQLQSAALGLGGVVVAGFDDAALATALGVEAGYEPVTMVALGHPQPG